MPFCLFLTSYKGGGHGFFFFSNIGGKNRGKFVKQTGSKLLPSYGLTDHVCCLGMVILTLFRKEQGDYKNPCVQKYTSH